MELLCLLEEFLHFLLIHVIHFIKVLETIRNVFRKSIVITLPVECDIFGIYLNEEDHTDLSCEVNFLMLEVLLHHCPEFGKDSNAEASVIFDKHF
jgi:hypothetical protein